MNISSIVLKIPETESDYGYYCPLNLLITVIKNKFIDYIEMTEGNTIDEIYELEEVNGQTIKIADLKCKTFAEFVVAININNLNHNVN